MDSDLVNNFTVPLIYSHSKDIFLNVTGNSNTTVVFENATAVLINISNETFTDIMHNFTLINNTVHNAYSAAHYSYRTLHKVCLRL